MDLRHEAMLMLEKRGAILTAAAKISRILAENQIDGAVIGGVAVVLHGHIRTTADVDVLVRGPLEQCQDAFESAQIMFDPQEREFNCDGVPVHLVPEEMVQPVPDRFVTIDEVTTVRLGDLISMKLHSGTGNLLRAQDLADVIGLIRRHKLDSSFAPKINRPMRAEFEKLAKLVQGEARPS